MKKNNEKELERAFEDLCNETYKDLKSLIHLKTKDNYITDDVLQSTYATASKKKKELLAHSNPKGWLYVTAVNIYMNLYRKNKKIRNNEVELTEDLLIHFDNNDDKDKAEEILSSLSEKDRLLFEEHFYNGFSIKEIAAKQNVTYGSLQRYFHRLIQKVKKDFQKK